MSDLPPTAEKLGLALSYFERVLPSHAAEAAEDDEAKKEEAVLRPTRVVAVDAAALRENGCDDSSSALVAVEHGARYWIKKGSAGLLGSQGRCSRDEFEAGAEELMESSSSGDVVTSLARTLHRGLNADDFVFVSAVTKEAPLWRTATSKSFEYGSVPFDGLSDEDGRRLAHAVFRSLEFYDGEHHGTHVNFSSTTMPTVIEAIEREKLRAKILSYCRTHRNDWSKVSRPPLKGHSEEERIRRVWKDKELPATLQQFAATRPILYFCTPFGNGARLADLIADVAKRMPSSEVDDVLPVTELSHYVGDAFSRVSSITRVFAPSTYIVDALVSQCARAMTADPHQPPLTVALVTRKYEDSWGLARELLSARRKVYVWMLLNEESLGRLRRAVGDDVVDSRLGWVPMSKFHTLTRTQRRTHKRILMWLHQAEMHSARLVAREYGEWFDMEL